MRAALVTALAWLALAGAARAQAEGEGDGDGERPARDGVPHALVIRPEPALAPLAHAVRRIVARRSPGAVEVGDPPPGAMAEAVPIGHVALVRADEDPRTVRLVLAVAAGTTLSTELRLSRLRGEPAARAVALAIESLLDSAATAAPADVPRTGDDGSPWTTRYVVIFAEAVTAARRPPDPLAKPTIFLRLLAGYSPIRGHALIGPGTGLGLCVRDQCFVIEGDLPLIAEESRASDGRVVRYRPVNFSARLQWRPRGPGAFTPGISFGLLTRVGTATLSGTSTSRVVSNLGLRATIELAWRFAPRFELVAEAGADLAVNRAQFVRFGETIALEDRWTPWFVVSTRLRP